MGAWSVVFGAIIMEMAAKMKKREELVMYAVRALVQKFRAEI